MSGQAGRGDRHGRRRDRGRRDHGREHRLSSGATAGRTRRRGRARRDLRGVDGARERGHPPPVRQPHRHRADAQRDRDVRALRGRVRRRSPVSPARLPDPRGDGGRAGARAQEPGASAEPRGGRDAPVARGDAAALSVSRDERPARGVLLAARWLRRSVPGHDGDGRAGPRAGGRDSHGHGGDGRAPERRAGRGRDDVGGRDRCAVSSSSPPARGRRASAGWPGSTCR